MWWYHGIRQNTDPTCGILFPSDGDSLPSNTGCSQWNCFRSRNPFESLAISWNSDIDGPLGANAVNADGSTLLAVPRLSIGSTVCYLRRWRTAPVKVKSLSLSLAPTTKSFTQHQSGYRSISALASRSTDADGDTVSYLYAWDLNGGLTGETSDVFPWLTTRGIH